MKNKNVITKANRLTNRDRAIKLFLRITIVLILFFLAIYIFLSLTYTGGRFTIALDPNLTFDKGIYMFEDMKTKHPKHKIYNEDIEYMDNMSGLWLPTDIDKIAEGSHNGDNYLAHTFYLENRGNNITDYWYRFNIQNVMKQVDEAIRIMIIRNGKRTIYAKRSNFDGLPEKGTTVFYSDSIAVLENRKDMKTNEIDKYTIVIWLEGDDPDCSDNLIGGEIKANFEVMEEPKRQGE